MGRAWGLHHFARMSDAHVSRPDRPEWPEGPLTKPMCPVHGRREESHVVLRQKEGFIEYACSHPECDRSWIVKRLRA